MSASMTDAACRTVARGRITRRWTSGHRWARDHIVLVEGPGEARHVVIDAGAWWSAHPVTPADVEAVERMHRADQLHNLSCFLPPPLES